MFTKKLIKLHQITVEKSYNITVIKMLQPADINYVIYHNPCADGTGSAWAAWRFLKDLGNDVTYYPTNHGAAPPDVTDKNVLICDFSYSKEILNKMIEQSKNLLIIDHHKTAQEALQDVSDEHKIFDMKHSGAFLTWKFFFPSDKVPLMIEYIQDRDIWTNKMPLIKEYAAWFSTLDHDFEVYDQYYDDAVFQSALETKGAAMVMKDRLYIEAAVAKSVVKFQIIDNRRLFVVYINSTTGVINSDIGNRVLTKYPLADFSVLYNIRDKTDSTNFSLRSTNTAYDASAIATSIKGGGGHRNACGVTVPYVTNSLPAVTLDVNRLYWLLDKIRFGKVVVYDFELNTVTMNTATYRYDLGAYLLQDRYTKDDVAYQECVAVGMRRNAEYVAPDRVHIAIMWYFDVYTETMVYKIVFDKTLDPEVVTAVTDAWGLENGEAKRAGLGTML